MPSPVLITLPAADDVLRDEIEESLAPHAAVRRQPPAAFDLETVKLVIEVIGGTVGIAANVAAVMTFLLTLKDRARKTGKPSGVQVGPPGAPGTPLEQVDGVLLRQLLGIANRGSDSDEDPA